MQQSYIVTREDGNIYYYKDKDRTILHREDGPAVEYEDGSKAWFVNGKYHRLDGPAIEYANGFREWFVNGKYLCSVNKQGKIVNKMNE